MSDKENAMLVKKIYERMNAGEIESLLNSFAEDIEWILPEMENVPFAGLSRGLHGIREFFSKVFELQEVLEFEAEEYFARGNKVVAPKHFTMRLKSTGKEFSSPWAHVWTIKDGKVARFYEYVDTAAISKTHTLAQTAPRAA